jgi:hypothetical protein
MCFDDVAWERSEAIQDAWVHELFKEETLMAIGEFILKHRRGVPVELCDPKAGAFNVSFRMKFEDGGSAIIRFPKPGATMFPEEKVRNEVDIIRYIRQHTTIPVPFVLHWGIKEENPLGLGPFIIMEYIDHVMDLSDVLNTLDLRSRIVRFSTQMLMTPSLNSYTDNLRIFCFSCPRYGCLRLDRWSRLTISPGRWLKDHYPITRTNSSV